MTLYTYRRRGGRTETVECDEVRFMPGHVVFVRTRGRIVLAVRNEQVNDLREVRDREEPTL